ncbi:MAG: hypothetical protein ACRDRL_29120, partial [Sciscionella sp.]
MSEPEPGGRHPLLPLVQAGGADEPAARCAPACHAPAGSTAEAVDAGWLRAARWARRLAWTSLMWMCVEGGVGLWQGFTSGSISLIGWALGSVVEGMASVIVVWRFT